MDLTERTHPGWTRTDAERIDRTHLEIRCACGQITQFPWRLLPPVPEHVPVASLASRFVCKRCGCEQALATGHAPVGPRLEEILQPSTRDVQPPRDIAHGQQIGGFS